MMQSRKILTLISFFILIFCFHILLYYSLSGYKLFFKKVKYDGVTINGNIKEIESKPEIFSSYNGTKNTEIKSSYLSGETVTGKTFTNSGLIENLTGKIDNQTGKLNVKNLEKVNLSTNNSSKYNSGELFKLGDSEKFLLYLFKKYNLTEIKNHTSLFDLTNEYPDKYYEYISKDNSLILYFFTGKNYTDIYNIFDVISYNLPFKVKQVNNFGESSFYINLNQEVVDNYTRVIISYKKIVFGLKIKKDSYNDVKEILKKIK